MQGACDIGAQLYARTNFRKIGCAFKHMRARAHQTTSQSSGQSANSAPHNDHRVFHKLDFATI
jgi:hypothetical protein